MEAYSAAEAKDAAREHIRGVFHAITIPESRGGTLDEQALRRDVRHCIEVLGADGFYVHGYYGNYWLLTSAQRQRVLEIIVDEVAGRVPVICRCAHESLAETAVLIEHAEQAGADFVSLLPPALGRGSRDMVLEHFRELASGTRLGISVFNTAQIGYTMEPELFAELAEIDNVCALKNELPPAHTVAVRELVGDAVVVVDPIEDRALVNVLEFGQQAIFTGCGYLYNTARSQPMRDYFHTALHGDRKAAAATFYELDELRRVHAKWIVGPWRRDYRCPVAAVKHWAAHVGLAGGTARTPLPELSGAEKDAMTADLVAAGLP